MFLEIEMIWNKLNWNTYREIDRKKNINYREPLNGLTYLSWKYYGIDVEFAFYKKTILLVGKINDKFFDIHRDQFIINNIRDKEIEYIIFRPFFSEENIDELLNICIEKIGKNKKILFENFYKNDLEKLDNKVPLWNWTSNFIYLTEKFKNFSGKSLQKKRNLLNFYNNNYKIDSKTEILSKDNIKEIISFIRKDNLEFSYSINELNFYNDILNNFDKKTMSGLILYYKDKIIGFTLGYLLNDYYEIYIEKASKEIKGSFQYLISENLKQNNINSLYVDRQDGASIDSIIKSKKSYYPIKIYERNVYYLSNNN